MNIGSAIKELRKKHGYTQKDFAELCDISTNALCQIELNNAFPQKSTINKVCEVLEIPQSYLLFYALSEEDIPKDKKEIFNALSKPLKEILLGAKKPKNK